MTNANVIDLVTRMPDGTMKRKGKRGRIEWPRKNEHDKPISCVENTEALLEHYGVTVRFNLMTHEAEHIFGEGFEVAGDCQRNAAEAQVREWANEKRIYKAARFADQMTIIIAKKSYHPVADWIRSKPWDGFDRFEALFASLNVSARFMEAHGKIAKRTFDAWLVMAAAAATLPADAREGVAAQGVLCLQGKQGKRKTRWLMSLVPGGRGWAKEGVILDPSNRDSKQQATDAWIVELGELDGTFRRSDQAHLKGFLTSRVDTYRKAYARTHESIARRTVFAASVNEAAFLLDDTGSRRYWSLPVDECNPEHGIDMQQLWAQALHIAETRPEAGWLSSEEIAKLTEANKAFEVIDPFLDDLYRVFEVDRSETSWWNYEQIRKELRPDSTWSRADTIALGRALSKLGCPEKSGKESARLFALTRRIRGPST